MKPRLIELCLSPDLGGLELYMVRAAKALDDDFEVLSVINAEGKLAAYYRDTPYRFEALRRRGAAGIFAAAKKLAHLIDREAADVVHLHWTKDIPVAVLAKKLASHKPKLVQTRNMTMTRFKNDPYHRFLYRNLDLMLPVTHQVAAQLERFIPKAARPRIEVLYMGSDRPELLDASRREALRESFDMPGRFAVGMVGRINEAKGQHLLIEALTRLPEPVHAYFVGHEMKKGYVESLRQRARRLGVEARVHFLGFMKNPHAFYQLCDAVVLASRLETFGLVLIEAMQVGTPVVGSGSGGVTEIIDDGETGLLFAPGEAEKLAEALRRLYDDEALRCRLGEAGRDKAQRMFSNARQFRRLGELLAEAACS